MYPFQVAESSSKKDGNDFVIFEIIQIKCETKTHNEIVKLNDMRFWVFGCKEESERKRQKMRGGCSFSVGYLRLTCSLKKKNTWDWLGFEDQILMRIKRVQLNGGPKGVDWS